jgi:hypothetical protein
MFVRATESVAYDKDGNGKITTLIPGRVVELDEKTAKGLVAAGYVYEVEEREFETATAGPQRKRKN